MSEMTAGVFARRSRLSPKALRLYAANGVLVPETVDEVTGYKLYSEDRLRDARVVRMLRRLDMPLALVAEVLVELAAQSGHREAYTTITKAQVRFPDILSAYDAVETWVSQNGHTITGSPREVYFGDFETAAPDDPCVDIAFVIA
jgi:DNA-binding transcriptional MerR regulator